MASVGPFTVKPRISEWLNEYQTVEEIAEFYQLNGVAVPEDRPYAWSMTVSTLDGIIGMLEHSAPGGKYVALGHVEGSGAASDWRLLNGGWTFADAVLGTGAMLREEADATWVPAGYDDLVAYRTDVLQKPRFPMNIVLTGSGDLDFGHALFRNSAVRKLVVTTAAGKARIDAASGGRLPEATDLEILPQGSSTDALDYPALMRLLRTKYAVRFLDVSAGGRTIAALVHRKLVDELRVTIAGQLVGASSTMGIARPLLFNLPAKVQFTHENSPIVEYRGIRVHGLHHIFLRGSIRYRHSLT